MPTPAPSRWIRYRRRGWRASLGLHVAVLGVLLAEWLYGLPLLTPAEPVASQQITIQAVALKQPTVATVVLQRWPQIDADNTNDVVPVDAEELLAGYADPRWQDVVEPDGEMQPAQDIVSLELWRLIREAEETSQEDNLDKLAQLSDRLAQSSSEQSVSDINARLAKVLGTAERAEVPAAEPVAGEFDFGTAQLFDVQRIANEQGEFTYTATLVDAAGRKFESPMTADQGASAYRTMQIVKSNPLLEKVYRGVVMSLMDELLKAAQP
jgi:hypothetical protein